ncbi:MAG: hypothetical protein RhofKO_33980 [Rhodothermales bacterium]
MSYATSSSTMSQSPRPELSRQSAGRWALRHLSMLALLLGANAVLSFLFFIGLVYLLDAPRSIANDYAVGVFVVSCVPVAFLWSYYITRKTEEASRSA